MKRLIVTCLVIFFCLYPVFPQELDPEDEPAEEAPVATLILKKDQIPTEVQKSAGKDFTYGVPVQWSNFPYLFQKYGWTVVTEGSEDVKPDRYAVTIKTKGGGTFDAVYTANGKLLRSREILKDGPLPQVVETSLNESKYKNWKVFADKELIRDFENQGLKHYVVKVKNGNEKKALYFDEQGKLVAQKKILKEEKKEEMKMEKEEMKEESK